MPKAPAHIAARVEKFQARIREAGLDGAFVINHTDIRYLTGFIGEASWAFFPAKGASVWIISDGRFKTHIPEEAPHAEVIIRQRGKTFETFEEAFLRVLGKKFAKVGINIAHLDHAAYLRVEKRIGKKNLVAFADGLAKQRAVRDASELKATKKAVAVAQQAFLDLKKFVKPGMTELEVCAYLEYRMKCLGSTEPAFGTIVAADGHASHNHAIPGGLKVGKNSSVLIDFGATVDGYKSDITRILNFGKPKTHIQKIHAVCLEAMAACEAAIKPGAPLAAADKAARDVIESYGYTLDHGIGHGVGLNIHEHPFIGKVTDIFFEEGMVVTIEPGIYLGDKGGCRVENDYIVTAKGCKSLVDMPKDWAFTLV